jgi:hypothetical protein
MNWADKKAQNDQSYEEKRADYERKHAFPLFNISFVRLGSGLAYMKDGPRLEACAKTLAKAAYSINMRYDDEHPERHKVAIIGREEAHFTCSAAEEFGVQDEQNLPEVSTCLFMMGEDANGEAAHMYVGIMMHKLTGLIQTLAETNSCNPIDHTGFLLARAIGQPTASTRKAIKDLNSFGEDLVYLDYAR